MKCHRFRDMGVRENLGKHICQWVAGRAGGRAEPGGLQGEGFVKMGTAKILQKCIWRKKRKMEEQFGVGEDLLFLSF